jgi:hypothetical protein
LFVKNRFSQFSPIHELGKIQRQALNLVALCVGDAKERKYFGGKQEKHQEEERLDLGRRQSPLVYSCYQVGGRDDASPERTMMIL